MTAIKINKAKIKEGKKLKPALAPIFNYSPPNNKGFSIHARLCGQ